MVPLRYLLFPVWVRGQLEAPFVMIQCLLDLDPGGNYGTMTTQTDIEDSRKHLMHLNSMGIE